MTVPFPVPEAAVQAGLDAVPIWRDIEPNWWRDEVSLLLCAAAPHIAAAAYRRVADEYLVWVKACAAETLKRTDPKDPKDQVVRRDAWGRQIQALLAGSWLRRRADEIDGGREPTNDTPEDIAAAYVRAAVASGVPAEKAEASGRAMLERRADQAYYWSPEWQADEQVADAELARGEGRRFDTAEAAVAWLSEPEEAPDGP